MKKLILSLAIAMSSYCSYAQWNGAPGDIYYNTGKVGIGTTSPTAQLDVRDGSGLAVVASNAKILLSDITSGIYLRMDNSGNLQVANNSLSPLMTYLKTGNVGIGTTSPDTKLHIVGTGLGYPATSGTTPSAGTVMRLRDGSNLLMDMGGYAANGFWFQATDVGNLGLTYPILFNPNGGNVLIGNTTSNGADKLQVTGITGSYLPGSGTGAAIKWGNVGGGLYGILGFDPNGSYLGKFNGIPGLYLNGTSGNIGIGTASPGYKLDIETGGNGPGLRLKGVATGTINDVSIDFSLINAVAVPYARIAVQAIDGTTGIEKGDLVFNTANNGALSENMRISHNGNILIGQTTQANSAYKLDVKGKTRADEIVVNTSGADFVFGRNYSLLKLSDVKAYIDQNHHLPEIPSAKEMQTNGMSVGEINTKMLQKVEELTLYLIDKDKQLMEQQQQIDKLKTQVAKLLKQ